MSGEEKAKSVNVDPRCIQEALRMFLQPIKNDDPRLDFYTMYKRETTEYDTDYMQKHNEDLNTTLIFAGLFSAVSSAFVVDIQSKLEPDSSERSEAYLRAILLTLNRSTVPDEVPTPPPVWNGPPVEIITTLDIMYASLLMSLLAAFVAMLGKQWLIRYLRHTGGSMTERCGDRQRKFDGLEKWSFRLFIDGLPIMLQIALLLLACGLSRYMWSVNTSVARVVISLTVLGLLFYLGIVAAGTSSYGCPFQTPVSIGLRYVITQRFFISPINAAWRNTQEFLVGLSPPNPISLIYATWMDIWQGLIPLPRHFFNILRNPPRLSGTHVTVPEVGYQMIILLLRIDRALRNAKQRLVRRFRRAGLLPTTVEDTNQPSGISPDSPGLLVHVPNLEALRKQNTDNTHCVCWILQNITDPEAIDSAIRLAGTIRWFDGDSDHDPPFDLVVSTFEACFDSTGKLHTGMRDRAYFSARAILQINLRARVRSRECAFKYPIPGIFLHPSRYTDPDLDHIIRMLKFDSSQSDAPTLNLPMTGANTHDHLLWVSNLFADFARMGQLLIPRSCRAYRTVAVTNHQAAITNILLMWHMSLGGYVEEETFWAVDKSGSLEIILSHLSARVVDMIANGDGPRHLDPLLEFLAVWEQRPTCLISRAYQWCSTISETVGRLTSGHRPDLEQEVINHMNLLPITLKVGFRLVDTRHGSPAFHLDHTSYHNLVLESTFSSPYDDVIADGVCAWILDSGHWPAGSFAHHLAQRMERDMPFSPRLRRTSIHALECCWDNGFWESSLETVHLLNRLNVDVDDMRERREWIKLLADVIRSPAGLESLSIHYWRLLDKLVLGFGAFATSQRDVELMESLEGAGHWEKLEVWVVIAWQSLTLWSLVDAGRDVGAVDVSRVGAEAFEQVTLELLLRRPAVLARLEDLQNSAWVVMDDGVVLRRICTQARAEQTE